jgi:hypothetical protein
VHVSPLNKVLYCQRHRCFHRERSGCSSCALDARAQRLADELTTQRIRAHLDRQNRERLLSQIDNGPEARPLHEPACGVTDVIHPSTSAAAGPLSPEEDEAALGIFARALGLTPAVAP